MRQNKLLVFLARQHRGITLLFGCLCVSLFSFAQSDSSRYEVIEEKYPFLTINGYIKELGTLAFDSPLRTFRYDNLLHNRLNTTWNFTSDFTLKASVRNRIFQGYTVRNIKNYGALLKKDNGVVDMAWAWIDTPQLTALSNIDRLYFTYTREKWELSAGRQRINWGQTYVWNPHDLFNTYSYLDFDYEERLGTDAIRFQYYTGYVSGWEVAIAPGNTWDKTVAAFLWKTNHWNYDFQFLAGNYRDELAAGVAWAGDIKGIGLKGEVTYFHPRHHFEKASGFVNATLGLDYVFPNSLYLQGEFLWNGNWDGDTPPSALFSEPLPANNLFIAGEVFFLGATYQLHPLISTGISGILSPWEKLYILVPTVTFSLKNNLDFLLTSQILKNDVLEQLSPVNNSLFFRLKYSF